MKRLTANEYKVIMGLLEQHIFWINATIVNDPTKFDEKQAKEELKIAESAWHKIWPRVFGDKDNPERIAERERHLERLKG